MGSFAGFPDQRGRCVLALIARGQLKQDKTRPLTQRADERGPWAYPVTAAGCSSSSRGPDRLLITFIYQASGNRTIPALPASLAALGPLASLAPAARTQGVRGDHDGPWLVKFYMCVCVRVCRFFERGFPSGWKTGPVF